MMPGRHWIAECADGTERVGRLTILYNGGQIFDGMVEQMRCTQTLGTDSDTVRVNLAATTKAAE